MKTNLKTLALLAVTLVCFSFITKNQIGPCYISFKTATNLTAAEPDRLPETSEKKRTLNTNAGEVEVTRIDGYRILYNNSKQVPFVNLKVELSEKDAYTADQKNLIENLKYLNEKSTGMETKDIIELNSNGYKIYGLSRASIEKG